MAFKIGWKPNDVRESIWMNDPALKNVPATAIDAWLEDGGAEHLRPYCLNGQPTIIQFRNLTSDELMVARAPYAGAANSIEAWTRACMLAFRIGGSFVGMESEIGTPDGGRHPATVRERGVRMLADEIIRSIESNPETRGIPMHYGALILMASQPTDAEKKASSPPSTPTPSAVGENMAAITGGSPPEAGA